MSVSQSDFYGENFWGETLDWEKQASDAVSELCEPTVWAYAASLFAQKPFSNGEDDRYDEVRKIITKRFGDDAIDSTNEMWLKMLGKIQRMPKHSIVDRCIISNGVLRYIA